MVGVVLQERWLLLKFSLCLTVRVFKVISLKRFHMELQYYLWYISHHNLNVCISIFSSNLSKSKVCIYNDVPTAKYLIDLILKRYDNLTCV